MHANKSPWEPLKAANKSTSTSFPHFISYSSPTMGQTITTPTTLPIIPCPSVWPTFLDWPAVDYSFAVTPPPPSDIELSAPSMQYLRGRAILKGAKRPRFSYRNPKPKALYITAFRWHDGKNARVVRGCDIGRPLTAAARPPGLL